MLVDTLLLLFTKDEEPDDISLYPHELEEIILESEQDRRLVSIDNGRGLGIQPAEDWPVHPIKIIK